MSIRNPRGHDLAIRNVTLERRTGYPIIVQTGGTLTLNDIALVSRKPHRRSAHRKPAIPVACIVVRQHGFLKARHLAISQIDGVVIGLSGRGTTGILSFAEIRDNVVASSAIDADTVFGTIDVSSEAVLLIEQSVVANNDFCGICIHEQSRMHLRNATVTGTRGIDTTTGLFGGYNVWARPGATAELRDFEISNAICGIRVQAAYLTAEDGLVTNNTIGLSVDDPPNAYFFRCASLNVAYSQNERNLDSSTLPEPSTEPPPECARVPWIEG